MSKTSTTPPSFPPSQVYLLRQQRAAQVELILVVDVELEETVKFPSLWENKTGKYDLQSFLFSSTCSKYSSTSCVSLDNQLTLSHYVTIYVGGILRPSQITVQLKETFHRYSVEDVRRKNKNKLNMEIQQYTMYITVYVYFLCSHLLCYSHMKKFLDGQLFSFCSIFYTRINSDSVTGQLIVHFGLDDAFQAPKGKSSFAIPRKTNDGSASYRDQWS